MLAVTVELLAGRFVATQFNDRSSPEWPPHPARLFSAAVAAWAEHDTFDEAERAALEWWEQLEPPTIACSLGDDLSVRSPVTHFVPVNDTSVVARDTAATYQLVRSAEEALVETELAPKELAKREAKLAKARQKAIVDSDKAANVGDAPVDRLAILPWSRGKQAREYPTVIPADPTITYRWKATEGVGEHGQVLDQLLARVPRLGHSSTPVSIAAVVTESSEADAPTLEPGAAARSLALRVTSEGQLESLIQAFDASDGGREPRTMPARIQAYRQPVTSTDHPASWIGEDWLLLETEDGSRLAVTDVAVAARTLRRALMSVAGKAGEAVPEAISGHRPRVPGESGATAPTDQPHLMVLGLPFAARVQGTGELMGLAVTVPERTAPGQPIPSEARQVVRRTVERFVQENDGKLAFDGGRRVMRLRYAATFGGAESIDVQRWTIPATDWVSVTPVALDRNPGQLGHRDSAKREAAHRKAEQIIADACERIGLPKPADVSITLDAPTKGTRPVHAFPSFRTGNNTRVQVHAYLRFAEPVAGPIVIGAGRYHGLGLFSPIIDRQGDGTSREVAS